MNEVAGKRIGYENQELSDVEVLEYALKKARQRSESAENDESTKKKLAAFQAKITRKIAYIKYVADRRDHSQIEAANAQKCISDGLLVLSGSDYGDSSSRSTEDSLYKWAMKEQGKEVPEGVPPITQILDVDGNRTHFEHVTSEPGVIVPATGAESTPGTADKNLRVTLYFLAVALGRLVDELAEEGRINQPAEQPCINEDASLNLVAISNFVELRLNCAPDQDRNSQTSAGSPDVAPAEIHEIFLAILADIMAQLADQAREENWIVFRSTDGEINRRPFQKNHQFVSSRVYNHLLEVEVLEKYTPNQGKSSVLHKLNDAKKVLASTGIPQYSPAQILSVLEEAHLSYQDSLFRD
jgi:hypothetical protein